MNITKDSKWRDGKALERYTLIAPLLEDSLDPAKQLQMREDIASMIIPGASEPSVRTLRATIPENESQPNFLILV